MKILPFYHQWWWWYITNPWKYLKSHNLLLLRIYRTKILHMSSSLRKRSSIIFCNFGYALNFAYMFLITKHAEISLADHSLPIRERMTRCRRREQTIRERELWTWNGEWYAITLSRLYSHPICVACIVYRWDSSARQLEVEQAPWKTTPTFIEL